MDASDGVTLIGSSSAPPAAVLQVAPANGRREWIYVDPATGNIVRAERIYGQQRWDVNFSDFRAEGARVVAHAESWAYSDGSDAGWSKLESHTEGLDEDLRPPTTERALLEFPADKDRVDIPAQFVGNHIVIRVNINGRGLD